MECCQLLLAGRGMTHPEHVLSLRAQWGDENVQLLEYRGHFGHSAFVGDY